MHEVKNISIPQPVETYESPYRSTCSIPAALNNNNNANNRAASYKAPDSPHSSKSVPWMRSHQRGLFGINSSPKSVRSATSRVSNAATSNGTSSRNRDGSQRRRSSSVESHSSNDSRSGKKWEFPLSLLAKNLIIIFSTTEAAVVIVVSPTTNQNFPAVPVAHTTLIANIAVIGHVADEVVPRTNHVVVAPQITQIVHIILTRSKHLVLPRWNSLTPEINGSKHNGNKVALMGSYTKLP